MLPVTRAPVDDTLPILWFVVTVAEISVSPHAWPVTVIKPVAASTVTICGVFELHTTWFVMSFETGGCMKLPIARSWTVAPTLALTGMFEAPKVSV
jgi:hypothetical protein